MSLRWRFAVILATVAAVAAVTVSVLAFVITRDQLRDGIDDFLVARADEFSRDLGEGGRRGPPGQSPPVVDPGFLADPDALTQFVDRDGDVVSSAEELPVDETDLALAAEGGSPVLREVSLAGQSYRMVTAPLPEGGVVQVARSLAETQDALDGLVRRMVALSAAAIVVSALVGFLVARWVTRPVERLTAAAEQIASTQDLVEPIPVERADEVGRLAASFNAMLAALEESRRQQRQLIMDASHELRTPLTTVRANIELLQRGSGIEADERGQIVDDTVVELEELSDLVAELVDLATEVDRGADEPAPVDLAELVGIAVSRFARREGPPVRLTADRPTWVSGRRHALERAVSNLVDNACKFSPPDGAVSVVVESGSVLVRDEGPGIAAADRDRVFDRFWRATTARQTPGSGLGLAIVRQVVEDHGGELLVDDSPAGGAEVGFRLAQVRTPAAGPVGTPMSRSVVPSPD